MRRIAITGGLSSGKSSVCQILQECGAYVVDADQIIHQLLTPETSIGQHIVKLLGPECLKGATFDRKVIADKVFRHPKQLKELETLLYPDLRREIQKHHDTAKQNKNPCFVVEIPLLFEKNFDADYDTTIALDTPQEVCINRFIAKTHFPKEEYFRRMKHHLSPEQKMARADIIIDNNGSLSALKKHVKTIYSTLTKGKQ